MPYNQDDQLAINTIRVLAVDATSKANSGHPGAPMGLAPAAHVLFNRFMKFNPKNPQWANRDRFVLSNGHGCMLQYALLHLFGYAVTIDDLKSFRTVDSICPGHPEAHDTPGIEVTTGPLGQGFSNAVGLAIAQAHLGAEFNKPGFELLDNYTYCFFGDGCAQEGVASEAASIAGHQQLGNLIMIYDDNHISIDGDIACAFTENVLQRFEAYGWHTQTVDKGDEDFDAIEKAIAEAQKVKNKPSVIKLRTTIGYGSKLQGTGGVHGNALKTDDAQQIKEKFGFNKDESFAVPQKVYDLYKKHADEGAAAEAEWTKLLEKYGQEHKSEHAEFTRRIIDQKLPEGWEKKLPTYKPSDSAIATRKTSEATLEAIHDVLPELFGGSADLTGSNNTRWKNAVDFQPEATGLGDRKGRYFRYGVREHGMAGVMNGLHAYGGIIPFGGTFLNFVSYAAGSVRLSSLSHHQVIYVATHDSIGLGEDGPTHQPIETLAHFRALPNCHVWRPADGNETSAAYYMALTNRGTPSILALTRQNLPQLEKSTIENAIKGGYVAYEDKAADITLVSNGSELAICIDAVKTLAEQGVKTRVVSLPCFEAFDAQTKDYRLSVLPDGIPALSVEALSTLGWERYAHEQFGLNRFGASGPYKDLYKKFEFTPEGIAKRAVATVDFYKGLKPRSQINRAFQQLI